MRIDRKAATREQLLGATEALLCSGGLAAVTTQSVAKTGGFAEGTIYRHFASLDELIVTTMRERLAGDFDKAVEALFARAGRGDVTANLSSFITEILPIYTILAPAIGMLAADPALAARNAAAMRSDGHGPRKFAGRVAEYFREEQRLGRIDAQIDARAAAGMLVSLCFYQSLIRHLFGEDSTGMADAEIPAAVAGIIGRGVGAQAPASKKIKRGSSVPPASMSRTAKLKRR